MNKRLKCYLNYRGITVAELEKSLLIGNGTLAKALRQGTTIGGDKIEKILLYFPDLSAEWLMRGNGEMLIDATATAPSTADMVKIKMLQEQVRMLTEQKDNCWKLIQQLTGK